MQHQLAIPFTEEELYGDWWEYLFLVSPDPHLTAQVREIKEEFFGDYNWRMAIDTQPHVTVASFKAKGCIEEQIIFSIRQACSQHSQFSANLNGYSGFEHRRHSAIYICIEEHQCFLELADSLELLNRCLYENRCEIAYLVNHPHLTIARGLPYFLYEEAIEEYRTKSFSSILTVDKLVLLKRRHRRTKYQPVSSLFLSAN